MVPAYHSLGTTPSTSMSPEMPPSMPCSMPMALWAMVCTKVYLKRVTLGAEVGVKHGLIIPTLSMFLPSMEPARLISWEPAPLIRVDPVKKEALLAAWLPAPQQVVVDTEALVQEVR